MKIDGLAWQMDRAHGGEEGGHGIAVDGRDHIYLGGNATGTGNFGKASIESKTTAAIVVKLSPDGEGVWASVIPGAPSALYHEIACDSAGRVWGAGMFKGAVTVAGQTFQSSGDKDSDGLIVHLDTEGRALWARHLHGPGTDYCLGVATDDHGTAFVCGDFNQDTSLSGRALVTRGSGDIFLAAFDAAGGLAWVRQAGGKLNDNAYPLAFRSPGELIIAGAFAAPGLTGVSAGCAFCDAAVSAATIASSCAMRPSRSVICCPSRDGAAGALGASPSPSAGFSASGLFSDSGLASAAGAGVLGSTVD